MFSPQPAEPARLKSLQEAMLLDVSGRRLREPDERAQVFRDPPAGTLEQRWHIYSSGYVIRIAEALENDYPAVRRILGPGPFTALTRRYLLRHWPRSFDLGRVGDRLASFLEDDPLTRELPFLPDLARLEWLLSEAFLAADAETLAWSDLRAMAPEAVADRPLALLPGTALVRSAWPLLDLWKCKDEPDDKVSIQVEGRPSTVLVFRKGLEARCRPLEENQARLIEAASRGASLADIQVGLADGEDRDLIQQLLDRFRRLVDEGVFQEPGKLPAAELS